MSVNIAFMHGWYQNVNDGDLGITIFERFLHY